MRYRPRVSIRDCVFLVLIFALAAGWWAERRRAHVAEAKLQAALAESQYSQMRAQLAALEAVSQSVENARDEAEETIDQLKKNLHQPAQPGPGGNRFDGRDEYFQEPPPGQL